MSLQNTEQHGSGQAWRSKAGMGLAGAVQRGQLGKLGCLVSVSGLLVRTLPWVKKGWGLKGSVRKWIPLVELCSMRWVKGTSRQLRFLEPMLVAWEKNWLTTKHCDPATVPHLMRQFKTIPCTLSACAGCKQRDTSCTLTSLCVYHGLAKHCYIKLPFLSVVMDYFSKWVTSLMNVPLPWLCVSRGWLVVR